MRHEVDRRGVCRAQEHPISLDRASGSESGPGASGIALRRIGAARRKYVHQSQLNQLRLAAEPAAGTATHVRSDTNDGLDQYAFDCGFKTSLRGAGGRPDFGCGIDNGYRQLDETGGRDGRPSLARSAQSTRSYDTRPDQAIWRQGSREPRGRLCRDLQQSELARFGALPRLAIRSRSSAFYCVAASMSARST